MEKLMKKFLLATVGLVALGMAAPASAADLAARPYTKAPPMVAAVYDWSGFYVGANGGWGSSHKCYDITIDFFIPSSRIWRDGQVIHENTTVSSSLRLTAIGNDVNLPSGTSSPQHST